MSKKIIPKTAEVYIVRFHPTTGNEIKKYRPAIIVSDINKLVDKRFTTIIPLSTVKMHKDFEIKLSCNVYDFLLKDSYALCWYIRTIDVSRLVHKLGNIKKTDFTRIKKTKNKL